MSLSQALESQGLSLVKTLYSSPGTGRALHHVRDRKLSIAYALKQFSLDGNTERAVLNEIRTLNRMPFGVAPHCHRAFKRSGDLYILLDWIDGTTLSALFAGSPFDVHDMNRRIAVLRAAAYRLDTVHRARIYHRDIKPENVIVQDGMGTEQLVHLIDFGLAVQDRDADEGTREYRAPEQSFKRQTNISRSTDIFAMGQVGWFLLSGQPRNMSPNFDYTDWDPESSPQPAVPVFVPRSLTSELDRATEFNPRRRHQSARAFASGIRAALQPPARTRRGRR